MRLTLPELTYAEAISEATCLLMERDPNVVLLGIGLDYSSGVFGTTSKAHELFGSYRVMDTPAMENALTGIAIGGATVGLRPILVHARNDFMFLALDQMLNVLSKWNYMFSGQAGNLPVVIRAIIGRGWGQGATHSQSIQSLLAHFPGLRVVMPSTPADAKGMLIAAATSNDPVVILEHRSLFNVKGEVPSGFISSNLDSGKIMREGSDVTIIATSICVQESLIVAEELEKLNISAEILDLRSIQPIDRKSIIDSVSKTQRVLVFDTSWTNFGVGAEVGAIIAETKGINLKVPLIRIGQSGVPAPVSKPLEDAHYPSLTSVIKMIQDMVSGTESYSKEIRSVTEDFKGPY
jgi:pyruvate/2-oxoglutarate/acetoin dehydrogenase E1 component